MKVTLVLAALLGFGTASAVAQNVPSDPSGTQTISEKDLSKVTYNSSLERFLGAHRQRKTAHEACRAGAIPTGRHAPIRGPIIRRAISPGSSFSSSLDPSGAEGASRLHV